MSEPTPTTPAPLTGEELVTRVLSWLGLPAGHEGPDDAAAKRVAPAVVAWAGRLGLDLAAEDVQLGVVMLAARLVRRRNSPAGIEAFTADGTAYTRREDPDVARLLRIEQFARPRIG